tara:strand:+ start:69 stop:869 length:801 start_codon:yes stop_codon:yes gene_type:complete
MKYPYPAQIIEISGSTSVGHAIWLAPKKPWDLVPKPGQFVMVWLPHPPKHSNRNVCDSIPMSIAGWDNGCIRITVKNLGPTSGAILDCQLGDYLGLTGPLGNGFSIEATRPLLMGGGVGAPPLLFLAELFIKKGITPTTLLGGSTKDEIFHIDDFPGIVHLATDDGSIGYHGRVTELLQKEMPDQLYACGPEPMLAKGLKWALREQVPAELCLERHMACGIGLCGICSLDEDLVCQDGPVFSGNRLEKSEEFGIKLREAGGKIRVL